MDDTDDILQCQTCGAYNTYSDGVHSVSLNNHTGLLQCYRCFCRARLLRRGSEEIALEDDYEGDMFGE